MSPVRFLVAPLLLSFGAVLARGCPFSFLTLKWFIITASPLPPHTRRTQIQQHTPAVFDHEMSIRYRFNHCHGMKMMRLPSWLHHFCSPSYSAVVLGDCIDFTSVKDLRKQPVKLKKGYSQSLQKSEKTTLLPFVFWYPAFIFWQLTEYLHDTIITNIKDDTYRKAYET